MPSSHMVRVRQQKSLLIIHIANATPPASCISIRFDFTWLCVGRQIMYAKWIQGRWRVSFDKRF